MNYQTNHEESALFYQRNFSSTSIQAKHDIEIFRPVVHVCDVTLLCIIALSGDAG